MYSLMQGNLQPDMLIPLKAPAAQAALATALQVTLHWKKPDGTVADVALAVVMSGISNDPNIPSYCVKRVWATGDSDVLGQHLGTVVVTCANGETTSDPNDGSYMSWWVYPNL